MRNRWIQFTAAMLCTAAAIAVDSGPVTTRPVVPSVAATKPLVVPPAPVIEKHEPVPPPPPPPAVPVTPVVHPASTQAALPIAVPPPMPVAATQPGPIDDRLAYAIGYAATQRIREQLAEYGRSANHDEIMRGMLDGISGRDPAVSKADVEQQFIEFQAYTQQRRAEKMYAENPSFKKQADDNQRKSRALLDQNAEMAGVDIRPDGVQTQLITPGTGRVVGNAKTLTMKNLRVSLADGTMVKSTDGETTEKSAVSDLLPALVDSLRGMHVGSKCRVWLPPDKAFGLTGKSPVIGPNQAIEYEFELVGAE